MSLDAGQIETLDASGRLLDEWQELASRSAAQPFLQPGFVLAWQRAFGRRPLELATARRDGELCAALPLTRRAGALVSPANWHTPITAPLASGEDAAAALAVALGRSAGRRVSLAFLDREAPSTVLLEDSLRAAGHRILTRTISRPPYLELTGDWSAFEAQMTSAVRSNLRRLGRRLAERGELLFDESDGSAELDRSLQELFRVEGSAWKAQRGTAIASRRETRAFYSELARWAAGRGWLRLVALRLDGEPIAASMNLEANGVLFVVKLGFDPRLRSLAPGIVMVNELIRRAFKRRLSRVEMLGADEAYKRRWCPEAHELIALQAFPPTLRGQLDRLLFERGRPLAKRLAGGALRGLLPQSAGPRL